PFDPGPGAIAVSGRALGVEVPQQRPVPGRRRDHREVDRGGGLADPALGSRDRDDPHLRTPARDRLAGAPSRAPRPRTPAASAAPHGELPSNPALSTSVLPASPFKPTDRAPGVDAGALRRRDAPRRSPTRRIPGPVVSRTCRSSPSTSRG